MADELQNYKDNTPSWAFKKLEAIAWNRDELLNLLEEFCERAGIMEYDSGQSRFTAEKQALDRVIANHRRRQHGHTRD